MTDKEKGDVLNALYGYKTFKKIVSKAAPEERQIYLRTAEGGTECVEVEYLKKAVFVAEKTLEHFELCDETKGKFVRSFFFERVGWIPLTMELNISHGTVHYWRNEVLEIAYKIAVKYGLI